MATTEMQQAKFVFRGTVKRTKAATMSLPDTSRTVVVRVDQVVRAPEALHGHEGEEITVQLAASEKIKKGQTAIFYTNGWLFGASLAVQSVGHEAVAGTRAAAAAGATVPAETAPQLQDITTRAAAAAMVVSGKVVAVGLPGAAPITAAMTPTDTPMRPPISEHDPVWREAVVEVQEVHKGPGQRRKVVVRFPASTDVRWYRAPKFQVGQEGVFMLHADAAAAPLARGVTANALTAMDSGAAEPGAFTCLNPADFQPTDHPEEAAAAIRAATGNA